MWTSKIVGKRYENGALFIDLHFLNGEASVARTIDLTGGSLDVLSQKIQAQLDTLNATEALVEQVILGDFTPVVLESKEDPLQKLRALKEQVDLGVIEETDPKIAEALAEAKQAVK